MKFIATFLLIFSIKIWAEPLITDRGQFRLYTFDQNKHLQTELSETIQLAYDKFEYYFGVPAQAITVVAFPSAALIASTDLSTLSTRGKILPFVVTAQQSEPGSQVSDEYSVQLLIDFGLKVKSLKGAIVVQEVLKPLVMLNGLSDIQIGDQLMALNEQGLSDINSLSKQIDELKSGEGFSLKVMSAGENKILHGKKLNLNAQKITQKPEEVEATAKSHEKMLGALQHEIGHYLLIAHMNEKRGHTQIDSGKQSTQKTYGSLKTPDWLDELVANMCESDWVKKIHKNDIKQISDLMPLETLLTTRHPSMDSIINSKTYQDKLDKGAGVQTIVLSADDFTATEKQEIFSKTGTFYGSSLLFGEYLYHQGGKHLLKSLIENVRINKNNDFSFVHMLENNDSLANTIEEVESDFHRFVAQRLNLALSISN